MSLLSSTEVVPEVEVDPGDGAPKSVLYATAMVTNTTRTDKSTDSVPCNYCTNSVKPATDSTDVSICVDCIQQTAEEVGL